MSIVLPDAEKIIPEKRYEDNADGISDATATSPRNNKDVTSPRSNKDMISPRSIQDVTSTRSSKDVTSPRSIQDVTSPRSSKDGVPDRRNFAMNKATLPSAPIPVVNVSPRGSYYTAVHSSKDNANKHDQVAPIKIAKETFQVSTIKSPAFSEELNRSKNTPATRSKETLPPSPEAVVSMSSKNVFQDNLTTSREWKSEVIIPENTVISMSAPSVQHELRTSVSQEQKHRRKDVHSLPSNLVSSQSEFTKTTLPATTPPSINIAKRPRLGAELTQGWFTAERLSPEIKLSNNEVFQNTLDVSPVAVIKLPSESLGKTPTEETNKTKASHEHHASTLTKTVNKSGQKDQLKTQREDISKTGTSGIALPQPAAVIKPSDKSVGVDLSGKSRVSLTKMSSAEPVVRVTSSSSTYMSQKQKDDREVQMINSSTSRYPSTQQNVKDKPDTAGSITSVVKDNMRDVQSVKAPLFNKNPTSSVGAEFNKDNSWKDARKEEITTSKFRHIDSQQRSGLINDNVDGTHKTVVPQSESVSSIRSDRNTGDVFHASDSRGNQNVHEWDDLEISVVNRLESTGFRRDSFTLDEQKSKERRSKYAGHSRQTNEEGQEKDVTVGRKVSTETTSMKDQTSNSKHDSGLNGHQSVKESQTVSKSKVNTSVIPSQHHKEHQESGQLQQHIYKFVSEMNPDLNTDASDRNTQTDHKTTITSTVRNVHTGASSSIGTQKNTTINVASPTEKEDKSKTVMSSERVHKHFTNDTKPEIRKDDGQTGILPSRTEQKFSYKSLDTSRITSSSNKTPYDSSNSIHTVSVGSKKIRGDLQTTKQSSTSRTSHSSNKTSVNSSRIKHNDSKDRQTPGRYSNIDADSPDSANTNLKQFSHQSVVPSSSDDIANKPKQSKERFDKQTEFKTDITKMLPQKDDASSEAYNDTGKHSFESLVDSNSTSELGIVNHGKTTMNDNGENISVSETLYADDLSYDSWQNTSLVLNESGILPENDKQLNTVSKDQTDFREPSISKQEDTSPSHILFLYRMLCHFLSRPEFPFFV